MNKQNGFSFLEILLSLWIVTTVSLGLLSQQILIKQRLNTVTVQWNLSQEQDNEFECLWAQGSYERD